jgi:endonuclease YncB( thermonuclease family)
MATAAVAWCIALGQADAAAWTLVGRVVNVDDGDTVIMRTEGGQEANVRLSSIDAPEVSHANREPGRYGQPYGQTSKRYLRSLVDRRDVQATCFEQDRYGRLDCELFVDGQSVNRAMVAAGMAWANLAARGRYMRDAAVPRLQRNAQEQRAGLWADPEPIPPWEWRAACWQRAVCPRAE